MRTKKSLLMRLMLTVTTAYVEGEIDQIKLDKLHHALRNILEEPKKS